MNFKSSLLIFLLFTECQKVPIDESILIEVFPGRNFAGIYPKKVYEDSKIISSDGKVSDIYILRDKNEEYLLAVQNQKPVFTVRFVMQNYGAYQYQKDTKSFQPDLIKENNKPFIVQKIDYYPLGGDKFNSLFLEILSEEPPMGLFQVPIVYRDGLKIFDGLNLLTEEKFLNDWKYSHFSLMDSNTLLIHSPRGIERKYIWKNGSFSLSPQVFTNE